MYSTSVQQYLRRMEEERAYVALLRENYDYDLQSSQPMAPRPESSLTSKVAKTAAVLGLGYLGTMGTIGAARGVVRRSLLKGQMADKLTKLRAMEPQAVADKYVNRRHWAKAIMDKVATTHDAVGKQSPARRAAAIRSLASRPIDTLRSITGKVGAVAPTTTSAYLPANVKNNAIMALQKRSSSLPGYFSAAARGAISGIKHPVRNLYHASGLGYINREY
jgi:hypothetical protein